MLIQLYSADWQPVSAAIPATVREASAIRANEVARFALSISRDAIDAAGLQLASNILVMGRLPGRIVKRDDSGEEIKLEAYGSDDLLNGFMTPRKWTRWNGKDLATVVTDSLYRFRMARWTTLADWQSAYAVSQVEIINLPDIGDSVILATEPYLDADRYLASGYIVLRYQLPEGVLTTGRVVRWAEHVGAENCIKVQSRTADSEAALDAAAWSAETELVHAEEVEENETIGADIVNGDRWVDVRFNLYTDDRETVDNENETTIVGTTPVLAGVELIWREAGPIAAGIIPATGITVTETEYNRMEHLKVIQELCRTHKYTYRVRLDNAQLVLDLAQTFGTDKSNDVIMAHEGNCLVDVLNENDDELANVLHCWGAGSGAEQLYVELRDEASIALLKARDGDGERHADFEDTSITDLATLATKGQAELDRRKVPQREYQVRTFLEKLGEAWVQDVITVADPQTGTTQTAEIKELNISENSTDGEHVRIGLGKKIITVADEIISNMARRTGYKPQPPLAAPIMRAQGKHEAIALSWNMVAGATGYDVEESEDDGATWKPLVSGVSALRYEHSLIRGSARKYHAYAKRGSVRSASSNTVAATALDKIAPTISAGITVAQAIRGLTVTLNPSEDATDWSKVADWDGAEVHVGATADFVPDASTLKDHGKKQCFDLINLTPKEVYYIKVRVFDTSLNYSEYATHVGEEAGQAVVADYAQIRNNLPYTGLESLDADHPIEVDFYIPEETFNIAAVFLSAKGLPFRAYASGAASGGGSATTSGAGTHTHGFTYSITTPATTGDGKHTHGTEMTWAEGLAAFTIADHADLTHTVNDPGHYHTVPNTLVNVMITTDVDGDHAHSYDGYTSPSAEYYHGTTGGVATHSHNGEGTGSTASVDSGDQYTGITINNHAGLAHSVIQTGHIHETIVAVTDYGSTHDHNYNDWRLEAISTESGGPHSHEVSIPNHEHVLVFGIHEDSTPGGVMLYCSDDGVEYDAGEELTIAPDTSSPYDLVAGMAAGRKYKGHVNELDLTTKFSGNGWKKIKFTSSRLGRVNWNLIAKVDLTA